MSDPIRVLVVDDHSLFRSGVIQSLNQSPDIEVVGEADSGQGALEMAHELLPDVILLDVTMQPMDGIETLQHLTNELPVCKVIMLTVADNEDTLLNALKIGARGYVLKGVTAAELVAVVKAVNEGEVYVTPAIAASILVEIANKPMELGRNPMENHLSDREQAILELVVQGYTNRQIGESLHLAEKTIKHYMTNILQKLHANNRVHAAIIAERQGLLNDDKS